MFFFLPLTKDLVLSSKKNQSFFVCSRDGKALEKFLQDYFDGNLKRYLKSEPIPENNDGPVKVCQAILFLYIFYLFIYIYFKY